MNRICLIALVLLTSACAQTVYHRKTHVSEVVPPQGTCVKHALLQLEQEMRVQSALRESR